MVGGTPRQPRFAQASHGRMTLWGGWRDRYSALGHLCRVWEPGLMPRIHDEVLDSVFYVYGSRAEAEAGAAAGGTGFLVSIASAVEGHKHVYAVTNEHVAIRPSKENAAHLPVLRLNTRGGGLDFLDMPTELWTPHPDGDDVCVAPVELALEHKYHTIDSGHFIDKDDVEKYNIGPGDDIFMVGRFVNHEGIQKNSPSVRFGNIAMAPGEPIRRPDGFMQESFAVEMRSLAGYSGSSVFIYWDYFSQGFGREAFGMTQLFGLLGIDWGHIQSAKLLVLDGLDKKHPDGLYVRGNTAMSGVVPAWKLAELLQLDRFAAARAERDRQLAADAAVNPAPSQFD